MCSAERDWPLRQPGCPIRRSSDRCLLGGSPRLFAACSVLRRLLAPRHPPCALRTLAVDAHARYGILKLLGAPIRRLSRPRPKKKIGDLWSPTASRGARGPSGCPLVGYGWEDALSRYPSAGDRRPGPDGYATRRLQGCQPRWRLPLMPPYPFYQQKRYLPGRTPRAGGEPYPPWLGVTLCEYAPRRRSPA